jgi:hypothetical protein
MEQTNGHKDAGHKDPGSALATLDRASQAMATLSEPEKAVIKAFMPVPGGVRLSGGEQRCYAAAVAGNELSGHAVWVIKYMRELREKKIVKLRDGTYREQLRDWAHSAIIVLDKPGLVVTKGVSVAKCKDMDEAIAEGATWAEPGRLVFTDLKGTMMDLARIVPEYENLYHVTIGYKGLVPDKDRQGKPIERWEVDLIASRTKIPRPDLPYDLMFRMGAQEEEQDPEEALLAPPEAKPGQPQQQQQQRQTRVEDDIDPRTGEVRGQARA